MQYTFTLQGFDVLKISSIFKSPELFFIDLKTFLDAKGVEITPATLIQLAETDIRADFVSEGCERKKMILFIKHLYF